MKKKKIVKKLKLQKQIISNLMAIKGGGTHYDFCSTTCPSVNNNCDQ